MNKTASSLLKERIVLDHIKLVLFSVAFTSFLFTH